MSEPLLKLHFDIDGENFTSAGEASVRVKKKLRQLQFPPDFIRRVSIASVVADARARGKDDGDAGGFDARADGVAQVLGVAVGE